MSVPVDRANGRLSGVKNQRHAAWSFLPNSLLSDRHVRRPTIPSQAQTNPSRSEASQHPYYSRLCKNSRCRARVHASWRRARYHVPVSWNANVHGSRNPRWGRPLWRTDGYLFGWSHHCHHVHKSESSSKGDNVIYMWLSFTLIGSCITTAVANEIGNNLFGPLLRFLGVMWRVLNYSASLHAHTAFCSHWDVGGGGGGGGAVGLFVHTQMISPSIICHRCCIIFICVIRYNGCVNDLEVLKYMHRIWNSISAALKPSLARDAVSCTSTFRDVARRGGGWQGVFSPDMSVTWAFTYHRLPNHG